MTDDFKDGMDLDAFLGVSFPLKEDRRKNRRAPVEVGCGHTPPKDRRRHTDWNNFQTFTFDGYVAKVVRYQCTCCDNLWDHLLGVFVSEVHTGPGGEKTRRMTAMASNADWPIPGSPGHRKEVEEAVVPFCGHCIGDLGFDQEVDAKGQPYTHFKGEVSHG